MTQPRKAPLGAVKSPWGHQRWIEFLLDAAGEAPSNATPLFAHAQGALNGHRVVVAGLDFRRTTADDISVGAEAIAGSMLEARDFEAYILVFTAVGSLEKDAGDSLLNDERIVSAREALARDGVAFFVIAAHDSSVHLPSSLIRGADVLLAEASSPESPRRPQHEAVDQVVSRDKMRSVLTCLLAESYDEDEIFAVQ